MPIGVLPNGISGLTQDVIAGPGSGILDATVVAIQNQPVDPTPPTTGQYLRWDGTAWTPGTVSASGGSAGQTYFFNEATAGQAPLTGLPPSTKQLGTVAAVGQTTLTSGALVPATVYQTVATFVTDVGVPGVPLIPAGIWVFNVWTDASVLVSGDTSFRLSIYSYDDPAAPVLLVQSQPTAIFSPGSIQQYTASVVFPQLVDLVTTRIYVTIEAASATGGTITLAFGDSTPSFVQTSIPAISGTGLVHVVNGITNPVASLLVPADVDPANLDGLPAVESLRTLGTGAQQACAGNDPRLSDPRTPTGPAGGSLSGTYPNPGLSAVGTAGSYGSASSVPVLTTTTEGRVSAVTPTSIQIAETQVTGLVSDLAGKVDTSTTISTINGLQGGGNLSTNRTFSPVYGTLANTVCQGNDSRLSDPRTPTGPAGGSLSGTYPNPGLSAVGAAGTYGSATVVPVLTTNAEGRVTSVVNTPITFSAAAALLKMGNVAVVDQVNGNDLTGAVNGLPFATVNAAVDAIALLTGVTVWILPGSYTLTKTIVIPDTCSLRGLSTQTCKISWSTNTAGTQTLVQMGENSRIEDLSLTLTSTGATTNLIGVYLPGNTTVTSKLRTCVVSVNNANVATGATTSVYGLYADGAGTLGTATFSFNVIKGSTVNVYSNGSGLKAGIYQPSSGAGNQMSTRDLNIYVAAPTDAASTGTYVGIYTNNNNSQIQLRSTTVAGPAFEGATNLAPVKTISIANLGALSGLQTINGYTLVAGDRILVAGQTGSITNGIYVAAVGAWARAADMAAGSNANNAFLTITNGTYASQSWLCASAPAVVGTNALLWNRSFQGGENKIDCRTIATANTALSGLLTINGHTLLAGERILVTAQAVGSQNGIYVAASGAWSRAGDLPTGANAFGARTVITAGTYQNTAWKCTTTGTVGTASLTFVQTYLGCDILQNAPQAGNLTNGIQIGPGSDLVTKSAGGKPFSSYVYPTTLIYGLQGNLRNGTQYLWTGVQTASDTTQVFYRLQQKALCQGVSVSARGAPGNVNVTVTVLKSVSGFAGSGVDTAMKVTYTDGTLQTENYATSVEFEEGEFLALQIVTDGVVNPSDTTVELDLF
jgi:hypothetical protein